MFYKIFALFSFLFVWEETDNAATWDKNGNTDNTQNKGFTDEQLEQIKKVMEKEGPENVIARKMEEIQKLKEREEKNKGEEQERLSKLTESERKLEEFQKQLQTTTQTTLQLQKENLILKSGLDARFQKFVTWNTKEEIESSINSLKEDFKDLLVSNTNTNSNNSTSNSNNTSEEDYEKKTGRKSLAALLGK